MTLEEKMSQMKYNAPAIERLGIPAYNWWNECLHGVARSGSATVFPQAIGMAASFDTDTVYEVATAISDEARAKYNQYRKFGSTGIYQGLTFWSPNSIFSVIHVGAEATRPTEKTRILRGAWVLPS